MDQLVEENTKSIRKDDTEKRQSRFEKLKSFGTTECAISESKSLVDRLNHRLGICEERTGYLLDLSSSLPFVPGYYNDINRHDLFGTGDNQIKQYRQMWALFFDFLCKITFHRMMWKSCNHTD